MNPIPRVRSTDGIDGKDSVGLYLDAIAKTPLLSAEDEVDLAMQIEAGLYAEQVLNGTEQTKTDATEEELHIIVKDGQHAMQQFVQANLRLVVSLARKFGRSQLPLLDLVQEGNTGLIRAVEKFDYVKGNKFSTYATWWVRQAISRGIAQQGRIVRLPVHVAEQINRISAVRRRLARDLGHEPNLAEIAAELDIEEQQVANLVRYSRDHVSLDAPIDADGDTALVDLIALGSATTPDEAAMATDGREEIESAINILDDRSADIVRRRFGLVDGSQAKLQDIGSRWGITAERVRQLERAALTTIREHLAVSPAH